MEESNDRTNKSNMVLKPNHFKGKNNNNKKIFGNCMGPNKNQKQFNGKKGSCFVCGKPEHNARKYRYRMDQKWAIVNANDDKIIKTLSNVCVV